MIVTWVEAMYWEGAAVQTRVTDKGEGGLARSLGQEVEESYISRAEQTTPGKQKESKQAGGQNMTNLQWKRFKFKDCNKQLGSWEDDFLMEFKMLSFLPAGPPNEVVKISID